MVQRGLGGRQDRRPQARTQVYLGEGQPDIRIITVVLYQDRSMAA